MVAGMADSVSRALGARVRKLRRGRGQTQEEFGASSAFDRNFVGRVERGDQNITLVTLARLAHAFGVTISELVAGLHVDAAVIEELDRLSRRRGVGEPRRVPDLPGDTTGEGREPA